MTNHTPKMNNSNNFKQPEALRLAELLERLADEGPNWQVLESSTAELRRLYAEVDRLSYQLAYPDNFVKEPEQEPVAYVNDRYSRDRYNDEISVLLPVGTALYTSPPARKPLTEELKDAFFDGFTSVVTYNDTQQNSPEEAWDEYKAAHGIKGGA